MNIIENGKGERKMEESRVEILGDVYSLKWNSVADKLPESNGKYILKYRYTNRMVVGRFTNGRKPKFSIKQSGLFIGHTFSTLCLQPNPKITHWAEWPA